MKQICRITGLELTSDAYFPEISIRSLHPIFELKPEAIQEIIESNPENLFGFQVAEQRLLLLALLNSQSFLIQQNQCFNALPEEKNLIPNLEKILHITELGIRKGRLDTFPKICIQCPADSMEGLPSFLDSILLELNGQNFIASNFNLIESLNQRIEILTRAISAGDSEKERILRASVAAWAMEVVRPNFKPERVSKDIQNYWKQILKTSCLEIKKSGITAADVAELEDFLISYLPHGSIASYEVLKQVRALKEATGSLKDWLFSSPSSFQNSNSGSSSYKSQEALKEYKTLVPMPKKNEYKSISDWMRALKDWNTGNMKETFKQDSNSISNPAEGSSDNLILISEQIPSKDLGIDLESNPDSGLNIEGEI